MEDSKELKVITRAMELVKHGYTLTSNSNRYPKKYRFSLVDRIQLKSMDTDHGKAIYHMEIV